MRLLVAASALTAAGLFSGCASPHVQAYKGPQRMPSEVCRLSVNRMRGAKISIDKIDDMSTTNVWAAPITNRSGAVSATVLPGKHRVYAHIIKHLLETSANLWWVAVAGHEYQLRGTDYGDRARIEIIDLQTGRTVGGIVGSIDEPAN